MKIPKNRILTLETSYSWRYNGRKDVKPLQWGGFRMVYGKGGVY